MPNVKERDMKCPECGVQVPVDLSDLAGQRIVKCRRGHSIKLTDKGGGARRSQQARQQLAASIERLNRSMKRFGRGR